MSISRRKFILLFFITGFVFLGVSTTMLGTTGPRGFPQPPDSVLRTGSDSPIAWKRLVSDAVLPIKVVLLGPIMPYINFLDEDPPPPFIGFGIVIYWVIASSLLYEMLIWILGKRRQ